MKKSSLCPGFRFHPTDVELVMYYLKRKLLGKKMVPEVIAEVNIYDFSPWDLPDKSSLRNGDLEWFFYCPKSKKYLNGSRMNRATEAGYWKASGKDREVKYKERTVAMIKTLVFHMGHPPKGTRTDWVMHEYRMEDKNLANEGVVQEAYALCRLFEKSGAGPKNGAQYGAPFEEEEWVDEDDESSQSGATTEIVNPIGTSSTYTNMTFYAPGPSTATSSENMTHVDKFTVTSSEALSVSGATKTLTSYARGSASAMTDTSLAEPDPAAITISELERYLDKSTVTSSAVYGLSGASEVPVSYARNLTVMNMTSTEPGPFTITSLTNETNHVPAKNDAMPTSEHVASIFHDNNTLEAENRNGKNILTDAPNEDDVTVLDSAALSTLDDLSLDGFDMFHDDGSTNFMMEAFLFDNLDDDLGNFF